jgi:hypothetical protein
MGGPFAAFKGAGAAAAAAVGPCIEGGPPGGRRRGGVGVGSMYTPAPLVRGARSMGTTAGTSGAFAGAGVDTVDPREVAQFEADAALWWGLADIANHVIHRFVDTLVS